MLLTEREAEALRHMLGADSRSPGFRNYYNSDPGDPLLLGMEEKGMVVRGKSSPGGSVYWHIAPVWKFLILGRASDPASPSAAARARPTCEHCEGPVLHVLCGACR